MKRVQSVVLLVALGLVLAVSPVFADSPAVTFDNLTGEMLGNGPFTLGWQFTVNTPITVTALGVFDDSQDGLVESHDVGIWNSTGALVTSGTVASGTVDPLTDQFRYVSASALLTPGNYNIGALWVDGADPNLFPGDVTGFATIPQITFVQDAFAAGGTLANPVNTASPMPSYFGPNFQAGAVVPEPSTILLMGTLLLGVSGLLKRKLR